MIKPLSELGKIVSGSTPRTNEPKYWNGDIPWVTPADLSSNDKIYFHGALKKISKKGYDSCSLKMLPTGTILFSSRAPIGHCAVTAFPLCTNQGFKNIIPNKYLNPLYGYFALKYLTPAIVNKGRGATFDEVTKEIMEAVEIPYRDMPEQKLIAEMLKSADNLRQMRRYALDINDTVLPSVFLKFFGDPFHNPNNYSLYQVEELFPNNKDGVKCGPFGSALKKDEYVSSGIPVWTVDCVGANEFREDKCFYITPQKYEELKAYTVRNGDIIVSRAGTVGRMAIVKTSYEKSIIHSNTIRLSLDPTKCLPEYFVILMTYFASKIGKLKTGQEDAYTFMNTSTLSELRIPLPPMPLQIKYVEGIRNHEGLHTTQVESLRQAEHLFQSLLHEVFSIN